MAQGVFQTVRGFQVHGSAMTPTWRANIMPTRTSARQHPAVPRCAPSARNTCRVSASGNRTYATSAAAVASHGADPLPPCCLAAPTRRTDNMYFFNTGGTTGTPASDGRRICKPTGADNLAAVSPCYTCVCECFQVRACPHPRPADRVRQACQSTVRRWPGMDPRCETITMHVCTTNILKTTAVHV